MVEINRKGQASFIYGSETVAVIMRVLGEGNWNSLINSDAITEIQRDGNGHTQRVLRTMNTEAGDKFIRRRIITEIEIRLKALNERFSGERKNNLSVRNPPISSERKDLLDLRSEREDLLKLRTYFHPIQLDARRNKAIAQRCFMG